MASTRSLQGLRALALAALLVVGWASGCSDPAPPVSEPSAAKQYLVQALDAWKSGASRESLTKGTPSILVTDGDWEKKIKLTDYKIEGEGSPIGTGVQWTVDLGLNARGKTIQKKGTYIVNVAGIVTVARQEIDL